MEGICTWAEVFQGECNKALALGIYRTGGFARGMWFEKIAGNIRARGVEGVVLSCMCNLSSVVLVVIAVSESFHCH